MADAMVADRPMLLDRLEAKPTDSLLALIQLCDDDPRSDKIDVGVGVYRDAAGATPILRCVKAAERILLEGQETKAYLGSAGDVHFAELIKPIVFGDAGARDDLIVGVQTPGGCGALRLGAELIRAANPEARIYVGQPTWPNHPPLMDAVGIERIDHPYYDKASRMIRFDEMMSALGGARAGDLVLLHGCCHNPTGADLDARPVAGDRRPGLDARHRAVRRPRLSGPRQRPGSGRGRHPAGRRRGRTGLSSRKAATRISASTASGPGPCSSRRRARRGAEVAFGNLLGLARTMWSMPPDHGAAVVRTVLDDEALRADWRAELDEMCARIRQLRARLAAFDPRLAFIERQNGMFSMLPLSKEQVLKLRADHGIYMADSGRFNVVGLSDDNVDRFAAAVVEAMNG
jgi:aromatic-amino-acid transaminase